MTCTNARILLLSISALATCACSSDDEAVIGLASDVSPGMLLRTRPWVDDFQLGSALASPAAFQPAEQFALGEPIQLSMAINYAPRGAIVTARWYDPNDANVGLQMQDLSARGERLRFLQADTGGWQEGVYRVEVWIGADKLGERRFEITGKCRLFGIDPLHNCTPSK
jgi:hypothetical protein